MLPLYVAVIVTGVLEVTVFVVAESPTWLCPAGTLTVPGTIKSGLLDAKLTIASAGPAGPESFTVTLTPVPPTAELALTVTRSSVAGITVMPAILEVLPNFAVKVTSVEALTPNVLTVKLAVEAPEATFTEVGTLATELFPEDRFTATPKVPAGPLRLTVPKEFVPAETVVRDKETLVRVAGLRVVVPLTEELPAVAVIFTEVGMSTPLVFWTYQ